MQYRDRYTPIPKPSIINETSMRKRIIQLFDRPQEIHGYQYPDKVFDEYRGDEIESLEYLKEDRREAIKDFARSFPGLSAAVGNLWREQVCVISKKKFFKQMYLDFLETVKETTFDRFCEDSNQVTALKHFVGCGLNPSDWYVLYGKEIIHVDEFVRRFCVTGSNFFVGNLFTAKI